MALIIYNSYNLPGMVNKSKKNAQNFFSALLSLIFSTEIFLTEIFRRKFFDDFFDFLEEYYWPIIF